jgi:hypothetical protein
LSGGVVVYIFSTRTFWLELNVPKHIVRQKFTEYFGVSDRCLEDRGEAIPFLLKILKGLQKKMISRLKSEDSITVIKDLYKILDECHHFYIRQKKARQKMVEQNVSAPIGDTFESNRNISRNIIDATNIWLENSVIFQNVKEETINDSSFELNQELLVELYIYGLASQSVSLLQLSKKFGDRELFYGLKVTPSEDIPAEVIKYHPIIYFNTLLSGNQNILDEKPELANANSTEFGKGFSEAYGVEFLLFLAVLYHFQANILYGGKYAMTVINKEDFIRIYGIRDIDYGDFDLLFYSKEKNELFLIEAKFFSDSLTSSGTVTDYEKLFEEDGYYYKCRRRYNLILKEPDDLKKFVGVTGQVNTHFLFVSSKPLDIEFQDSNGVVTFLCLSIFDKYIDGKLIDDNDDSVRPTHVI